MHLGVLAGGPGGVGTGQPSERGQESFTADAEESFPAMSQATGRMRATVGSR